MKINIYSIEKTDEYINITNEYIKKISQFGEAKDINIFNKDIARAQKISQLEAKKSYTQASMKYIQTKQPSYNIALDVKGKEIDSFKFAKLLEDKAQINFFIGGAYGWESSFLDKCDNIVSLSKLTMSHKIAKIVLYEQIFRGLSINFNHPYHK
jgi:23S rRNA (pseudouridine1915-N3)-methyltransferase